MSTELPKARYDFERHRMTRCQDYDGECTWEGCPQIRDGEPETSGRHCPLDQWEKLLLGEQP